MISKADNKTEYDYKKNVAETKEELPKKEIEENNNNNIEEKNEKQDEEEVKSY